MGRKVERGRTGRALDSGRGVGGARGTMGIFDRLGRVARSEVSEMKRVLREARRERGVSSDDPWDDQLSYEADILAADAELARDLGDPLSDVFARELGTRPTAPAPGFDDDLARGASLWGAPASSAAPATLPRDPAVDARPVNPGWIEVPPPSSQPRQPSEPNPWAQAAPTPMEPSRPTEARPGRTETFPREVREAYAVLELPLGADRSRIDQAFKGLIQRYHPDHHMGQPELQRTAAELTMRLKDARELLYAWLEGRR